MQIGTRGRGGKGWGEGEGEHEDEVVRQMSKIVHTRSVHLSQSLLFTTHCCLSPVNTIYKSLGHLQTSFQSWADININIFDKYGTFAIIQRLDP